MIEFDNNLLEVWGRREKFSRHAPSAAARGRLSEPPESMRFLSFLS